MTLFVNITDILTWGAIALCIFALFTLWVIETIKKYIKRKRTTNQIVGPAHTATSPTPRNPVHPVT